MYLVGFLSEEFLEDDVILNKGCVWELLILKIRKMEDYFFEEELFTESLEVIVNELKELLSGFLLKESGGYVFGKIEDILDEFWISRVCNLVERNEKIFLFVEDVGNVNDVVEYEKFWNLGIEINEKENIR